MAKGKFRPVTGREGPDGVQRQSCTLSLTSALDVGGWLMTRTGNCTLGTEILDPLYKRLGGPRSRSGQLRKLSPSPGFEPRTAQSVASHYSNRLNT